MFHNSVYGKQHSIDINALPTMSGVYNPKLIPILRQLDPNQLWNSMRANMLFKHMFCQRTPGMCP